MEWHKGHFHHEGRRKSQEQPELYGRIKLAIEQRGQVECIVAPGCLLVKIPQGDDACQHQQAAQRGIEHELEGRVNTSLSAPTADQEIGRNQHHFPENIEEEEVGGEEDADDAAFKQQHEGHVVLDLLFNAKRRGDTDHCEEGCQSDQQETDTVNAEAIAYAYRRNPLQLLVEEEGTIWSVVDH